MDASLRAADLRNANFNESNIGDINLTETIMPDGSVHP
jgi:hypothetical protein